ncbi:MAG: tRNA (5-methylaminomethyl-2-thiouridine)(34)-methyltransferase MnmD, partial [Psychromonas sp.]|nr:tRNA (5-methylaminomethyl-2-thiouridine)(34)-methyltransferase MnmD [Psychromonas sp.]
FTSFEKYPLKEQDLQKSLQKWPVISEFVTQLISQYPLAISGCHHLHFESITLDLWFGDVHDSLPLLYENQNSLFDCWYLDGFAPNKNPDMWNENLFSLIAQNSKFGATIATFTAAGFVRRGLQASGFKMSKRKGYGKKREMLVGELQNIATNNQHGSKR